MNRPIRVLRPCEVEGKTSDELRDLIAAGFLPPIAGADDGADGADTGDAAGDDTAAGDATGDAAGDDTGAAGDDWTPPTRDEYEALQKSNSEAQRRIRENDRAKAAAEQKAAEESGEHERLYGEQKAENERLRTNIVRAAAEGRVETIARRLNFVAPGVAHKLIDLDGIDGEVGERGTATLAADADATIEAQLKALAASPDGEGLTKTGRQRPQAATGEGDGGADTNADMNRAIRASAGRG